MLPNFTNHDGDNVESHPVFENSQVVAEEGIRKKKKKARNLFQEDITPVGNL